MRLGLDLKISCYLGSGTISDRTAIKGSHADPGSSYGVSYCGWSTCRMNNAAKLDAADILLAHSMTRHDGRARKCAICAGASRSTSTGLLGRVHLLSLWWRHGMPKQPTGCNALLRWHAVFRRLMPDSNLSASVLRLSTSTRPSIPWHQQHTGVLPSEVNPTLRSVLPRCHQAPPRRWPGDRKGPKQKHEPSNETSVQFPCPRNLRPSARVNAWNKKKLLTTAN